MLHEFSRRVVFLCCAQKRESPRIDIIEMQMNLYYCHLFEWIILNFAHWMKWTQSLRMVAFQSDMYLLRSEISVFDLFFISQHRQNPKATQKNKRPGDRSRIRESSFAIFGSQITFSNGWEKKMWLRQWLDHLKTEFNASLFYLSTQSQTEWNCNNGWHL